MTTLPPKSTKPPLSESYEELYRALLDKVKAEELERLAELAERARLEGWYEQ